MGLSAGPVPPRVDAQVKAGLLELVEHAVAAGWSARRACGRLRLDHMRHARWCARAQLGGGLADAAPGGNPVHAILPDERAAILALYDTWAEIDRSHRKLAHRGSREGVVHVSEPTMLRVLCAEGLVLHGKPPVNPPRVVSGRTGWNGNPTGSGDMTSPTFPGPARPPSRSWISSRASGWPP